MFDVTDKGQGVLFACLHNLSMLALLIVSQEKFGGDYKFIQYDGKYYFPATLPDTIRQRLVKALGAEVVFVPMAEDSPLILPEARGKLVN